MVTRGFKEDGHRSAIKPLALALAERMANIETRARPYDAARMVGAPLPGDAWAALGDSRSTYPEVIPCDHPEVECYPDMVDGLWKQPPVESAYSYFIDARALDDDVEYPLVGTQLIAYASDSETADAMGKAVGRWLARDGGQEFAVPGLPGAVGVRTVTPNDWDAPDPIGYTWSVFFTHGSALARAFVAGGPNDDEADTEDPADWDRNRKWAIDAARAWQDRLAVILG